MPNQEPQFQNRGSFRGDLKARLQKGPEMNMKNEAGFKLLFIWFSMPISEPLRVTVFLHLFKKVGKLHHGV